MVVTDRPRVFQGILPPIAEGLPLRPRGLLVGLPGGLSFELRTDDLRLLGVRSGGFITRTDWTGRGGTPGRPTGQIRYLFAKGNPQPLFHLPVEKGRLVALPLKFTGTFCFADVAGVTGQLAVRGSASPIAVKEAFFDAHMKTGLGFIRRLQVGPALHDLVIVLDEDPADSQWMGRPGAGLPLEEKAVKDLKPMVRRHRDGSALVVVVRDPGALLHENLPGKLAFRLPRANSVRDIQFLLVTVDSFSLSALEALAREIVWQ